MSVLQIQVQAPPNPALLEAFSTELCQLDATLLDVTQSALFDSGYFGLQVQVNSEEVRPALEVLAQRLGVKAVFTELTETDYTLQLAEQQAPRQILSLFGAALSSRHLQRATEIAARSSFRLESFKRLSRGVALTLQEEPQCWELTLRGEAADAEALRRDVLDAAETLGCDVALQADSPFRKHRRLIAFDMDSTLIQAEVIDELARAYGVVDQVSKITEAAMNGELDFNQSLERRLSLLKGLSTDVLQGIAERIEVSDGAPRLIRTLKALGYRTAILSGGFTYFGQHFQRMLGIDYVHANVLEVKDGALTGKAVGQIVNAQRKAELLKEIAEKENVRMEQVIAVGDGANDLPMLALAGMGVAFRAKPKVRAAAKQQITRSGLDGILYLLGLSDAEIAALNTP